MGGELTRSCSLTGLAYDCRMGLCLPMGNGKDRLDRWRLSDRRNGHVDCSQNQNFHSHGGFVQCRAGSRFYQSIVCKDIEFSPSR